MVLPMWRSLYSFNLMLPKEDRRAMLLRLYNEEVPLINQTEKSKLKQQAQLEEESEKASPATNGTMTGRIIGGEAVQDPEEVGETGVIGTEEEAMRREDGLYSNLEDAASKEIEMAEGVKDEEDVFNTTV